MQYKIINSKTLGYSIFNLSTSQELVKNSVSEIVIPF